MPVLRLRTLLVAVVSAVAVAAPAVAAPEAVPDRVPVASEPLTRAALLTEATSPKTPATKTADGSPADWVGAASGIGGTSRLDAGEHIYSDYLFDDFGADDGDDAQRLAVLGPVRQAESRTARIDQFFQAAGDQFGAARPVGAPDHYGDRDRTDAADLREVRWAADADSVHLLVRTTTMIDDRLALLVLVDGDPGDAEQRDVGFGSGLGTRRFEMALLIQGDQVAATDLSTGLTRPLAGAHVGRGIAGWTNALEVTLPDGVLPETFDAAVVAGTMADAALTPANVAYRFAEPVAGVYNDQRQALALHEGTVDEFTTTIELARLRAGASETARPGPGYAERHMRSGENISRESGEHGVWQPYGLFVPSSYDPATPNPINFWLHYRGGKAHSGGAWTPRLLTQLGEETGNIVVTPRARGTSTWYVTEAHQDFFEVFADVHQLLHIDPTRRYLSGYSMGGYGTYLFGLLYPDLFAAGYSTSGAVTQGLWTGEGPDQCRAPCFVQANGGTADAQLTYRVLENARHLPLTIHHGSDDQLVPITGIQRMGVRLAQLGYRYDLTVFHGYEHFTQAIVDEWADGAAYLQQFRSDPNPATVTYKVVPALVNAVNNVTADGVEFDFNPDGAYWVDGLEVRDGEVEDTSVFGRIDATSGAIQQAGHLAVPRTGAVSPLAHSTTYTRHGLDWLPFGGTDPVENHFSANLTNLSAAELDVERMQLDLTQPVSGTISSDGPATVTLTKVTRAVEVLVDGVSHGVTGGRVVFELDDGISSVELRPAR